MRLPARLVFAGAVAALAAAAPALGSDQTVVVSGFAFKPAEVSISAGETVTWRFDGPDTNHSVTAEPGQTETFDSDAGRSTSAIDHPGGFTYRHTFANPGTFRYFCRVHPGMRGSVRVTSADSPPVTGDDRSRPRISRLRAEPREFCKRHRRCRRAGTLLRFELSERATLGAQTIGRVAGGRRVVNSFTLGRGRAGANAKRFRAERLAPGRYLMKLTATDRAGNSSTRRLRFTVAPPLEVEVETPTTIALEHLRTDKLRARVRCNGTCALEGELRLGRRLIGTARTSLGAGRRGSVRVTLTDGGHDLLADRERPAHLRLTLRGTGPSGGTSVPVNRFITALP